MSSKKLDRNEQIVKIEDSRLIVPFFHDGKEYKALIDTSTCVIAVSTKFLDEACLEVSERGTFILHEFGFDKDTKYPLKDIDVYLLEHAEELGFDVVLGLQGLVGSSIFIDLDGTFKFTYLAEK